MIKISARLFDIVNHVSEKDIIIDVGCDHALLAIYLVQKMKFKLIYVSDNKKDALQSGIENIKKNGLVNVIKPLLGTGLDVISDKKINTLIISGLGSRTIIDILNGEKISQINKIIVQSNTELYALRTKIIKDGYKIIKETIVYDNKKHYSTMSFIKGKDNHSSRYLKFGFHNNIKYYNYLKKNISQNNKKIPNKHIKEKIKNYLEIILIQYHITLVKLASKRKKNSFKKQ